MFWWCWNADDDDMEWCGENRSSMFLRFAVSLGCAWGCLMSPLVDRFILKRQKDKKAKKTKISWRTCVENHKAILLKTNINVTIMISSSSSHRHLLNKVILEMVDFYAGTLLILALASIEIMAMNWIYGTGTIARYLHRLLLHCHPHHPYHPHHQGHQLHAGYQAGPLLVDLLGVPLPSVAPPPPHLCPGHPGHHHRGHPHHRRQNLCIVEQSWSSTSQGFC